MLIIPCLFYIQKEEVFSAIGSFSQNRDGGRSIHLDWIGGHFIGCLSQPSRVGEIRAGIVCISYKIDIDWTVSYFTALAIRSLRNTHVSSLITIRWRKKKTDQYLVRIIQLILRFVIGCSLDF